MKSVIVKKPGNHEQLEVVDMKIPKRKENELLIRVHSTSVNRTDVINREDKSGKFNNTILGVEISGEIVDVSDKSHFLKGDRVMGLVNNGGYAEYCIMPESSAIRIPDSLSYYEAAAIPEVFLTAYQTLFWLGKLKQGETVLIHAGASGVGTAAIQLAKHIINAKVIVTAGSKRKLDFCKELGADVVINYKEQSFDKEVLEATNGNGVDLILDFIGADYWNKNINSIKVDGRLVLIGILGGVEVEKLNLLSIISKRIQIIGTLLSPRSNEYKGMLAENFQRKLFHILKIKL